jgi:hypothetical protein
LGIFQRVDAVDEESRVAGTMTSLLVDGDETEVQEEDDDEEAETAA